MVLTAIKTQYQKVKAFYQKHERWFMPLTLFLGFLQDYITFRLIRIDTALYILFIYFFVAGAALLFVHLYDTERVSQRLRYMRLFAPLLVQFCFGSMLGGAFIFYWFSGTIFASWPFILALVLLMVLTEALREYFSKPLTQLVLYYFVTFSLLSIALPYFLNSISAWLFILAGSVSIFWIWGYTKLVGWVKPEIKERKFAVLLSSFIIFLTMNVFYFYNFIPPVPLSVREAGIYHGITRMGGKYILQKEKESFWQKILPGQTIHLRPGDRAFAYTAIFAPAELKTTVVHDWQKYDGARWVTMSTIPFAISGGRSQGYRGYSVKSNLTPGFWRVFVKTQRGQVLGRLKFKVAAGLPKLEQVAK